ncbi:YqzE family protein [Paenibacillus pinistramenti]|uniref:YqzE family protein n=1 Tax=Paenibacillus pinistramenti TaxID=1768003 RepID=UPI001109FBD0|nr:YqzE family protein [Paenibacillus pinistramenti]
MAKGDELVRFITERVVDYVETPKEIRKERKQVKTKEPWSSRWFGMIPASLSMLGRDMVKRGRRTQSREK